MAIFGLTFIQTVLTIYTAYRYNLQNNETMQTIFRAFLTWEQLFLISLFLVVYYADKLTNEVFEILILISTFAKITFYSDKNSYCLFLGKINNETDT